MRFSVFISSVLIAASLSSSGQEISSYFDYKVFRVPGEGHLIETYFNIVGRSVAYVEVSDSTEQAEVELKVIVTKGQGIKDYRKEAIKGPEVTKGFRTDFISTQRFLLPKGTYELEVELKDLNRPESGTLSFSRSIDLEYNTTKAGFSDIELLAGFRKAEEGSVLAKSGLEMLPLMNNVFDIAFNELLFYCELYRMDKLINEGDAYLLRYYLEDADFEKIQKSTEVNKRKTAGKVHAELGLLDISQVPTGRYNLRIEARSREDELLASEELPIYRINPILEKNLTEEEINLTFVGRMNSKDSLKEYIYSLRPIAQEQDRMIIDHQVAEFTLIQCKSYLYAFWEDRNPLNPSEGWAEYKKKVEAVEEKFGTSNKRGYETDMGRIYLVYGVPNSVVNEANDPETYPYQIWHYYKAGKFNDKRFVFYDRELLQREYSLLHSDVPGEVRNPRWNIIINSRTNAMWNVDQNRSAGAGSDRLQQLYDSPR
ncbi:MAG: GWxTD domain-containing protein [Flavobacteriales bacterium]|nr:GWxTD domain-containing protein [Flavobacteriales bacterium]